MKKKIIISLISILIITILIFPIETLVSEDGGSTKIYKGLLYNLEIYKGPPIGSESYKKGFVLYILNKSLIDKVDYYPNPNYPGNKLSTINESFDSFIGQSKNNEIVKSFFNILDIYNADKRFYKINLVGITNKNDLSDKSYDKYDVTVIEYYENGLIKTIEIKKAVNN